MDQQIRDFIRTVRANEGISQPDLAKRLGVSVRTVRTVVKDANAILDGVAKISLEKTGGYGISTDDEATFRALIDTPSTGGHIPTTPNERVQFIIQNLLMRSDWVTVEALAAMLFVSRRTVSNDLKQVETQIERFGLTVESRPYRGIRIAGAEMARRLCIADVVVETAGADISSISSNADNSAATSSAPGIVDRAMLEQVQDIVNAALAATGFQVSSLAYQNLLVHIAIAILRIRRDCFVPAVIDAGDQDDLPEREAMTSAQRIADDLERAFDIELPYEEVAYIAIHLAGKHVLDVTGDADDLVIPESVWAQVGQMVDAVKRAYGFDFSDDLELRMNLARHVVPLAVRLTHKLKLANPLLADIRSRYPLAYGMATEAAMVLARAYDSEVTLEETGYLALSFALAIERQQSGARRVNILIVCASGAGSARFLEWKYHDAFGASLGRIETCDASRVATFDFSGIDYVFTTVPLDCEVPVPVCEVGYFLEPGDMARVRAVLGSAANGTAGTYFDPLLFRAHLKARTKKEAIEALCAAVTQVRRVPVNFEKLVWERESVAQTCFGNQVAIPHPMEPVTDETFVAVGLIDKPIDWDGQPVRAVFLLSVGRDQGALLKDFYQSVARLLIDTASIQRLLEDQSLETLMKLLEERSKK